MYIILVSFIPYFIALLLGANQPWLASLLFWIVFLVLIQVFTTGWHWQLMPAYLLLVGLIVTFFLVHYDSSATWLKVTGISVSTLLLALSSLFCWLFPSLHMPIPTGSFDVGTRLEIAEDVSVRLFYPATPDANAVPYTYLSGVTRAVFGLPAFLYSHMKREATSAYEELNLASKKDRYPVIIYAHGADSFVEDNTFRLIELASHGFVVAAIEHPKPFSAYGISPQLAQQPVLFTEQLVNKVLPDRVRDVRLVVEKLATLNKKESQFQGKLELTNLGMLGFSFGGSVVSEYCLEDVRCKAIVNFDGSALGKARKGVNAAFLQLSQSAALPIELITNPQTVSEHVSAYYQQEVSDLLRNSKAEGMTVYWQRVKGTGHASFTDLMYWTPARFGALGKMMGKAHRDELYQTINALTLAFFADKLLAEPSFETTLEQNKQQLESIDFWY